MKKEEESAKKKKPKTSPAQLRVQKGMFSLCLCFRSTLARDQQQSMFSTDFSFFNDGEIPLMQT